MEMMGSVITRLRATYSESGGQSSLRGVHRACGRATESKKNAGRTAASRSISAKQSTHVQARTHVAPPILLPCVCSRPGDARITGAMLGCGRACTTGARCQRFQLCIALVPVRASRDASVAPGRHLCGRSRGTCRASTLACACHPRPGMGPALLDGSDRS